MKNSTTSTGITVTPNVGWSQEFWDQLVPLKLQIVNHPIITAFANGTLDVNSIRKTLINFYPIVNNFRDYMRLNLKKIRFKTFPERAAGKWLEDNISVEEKHAQYWIYWGISFGCKKEAFNLNALTPAIKYFDDFLTETNSKLSLEEGLASTNLAIEWPTGEWVGKVRKGMDLYVEKGLASNRTMGIRWIKAHEIYDDIHPYEAMELIKLSADTHPKQIKALRAAQSGMEYYLSALNSLM